MNSAARTALVLLMGCCLAVAMRLGGTLPNVTAIGALALYAGSRLSPRVAWIPALAVMVLTDLFLHRWRAYDPSYPTYACFILDASLGWWLIRKTTLRRVGGTAFLSALQFFLITN